MFLIDFYLVSGPCDTNSNKKSISKQFGYNKFENEQNGDMKLTVSHKSKSKSRKEVTEGILVDINNSISVSSSLPVFPTPQAARTSTSSIQYSPSLVDLSLTDFKQFCCIDRKRSPDYDTFSTYSSSESTREDRYYNIPPSETDNKTSDRYYSVPPDNQSSSANYYSPVAESSGNYLLSPLIPASTSLTRMGSCPALPTTAGMSQQMSHHISSHQMHSKPGQISKNGDVFKDLLENFDELSFKPQMTQKFPTKCQTATICDRNQILVELKKTLGQREMHSNFSKGDDKKPNIKIPLLQPPQPHVKRKNRGIEQPSFPSDVPSPSARITSPPPVPAFPPNTAEVKPFLINNPVTPKNNLSPNNTMFNFYPSSVTSRVNSNTLRRHLASMQNQVSGVTMDECQVAYQKHNGNIEAAVKELQLMQLCRLGIAPESQCEKALRSVNWNLELAASSLVDEMQSMH